MRFTKEDFELCKDELSQERMTQRAAHLANLKLDEWLKDAQPIYSYGNDPIVGTFWCLELTPKLFKARHKAKLVCIEDMPSA